MSSKKGLGKGLGALMGSMDLPEEEKGGVLEIPVNLIDPLKTQPRQNFDQEKLLELAESVKQHGILQPLILKAKNGRYSIIAGERRYRAARKAGLKTVPAILKDADEKEILQISIIENIQREDLNPVEEAEAIARLMEQYQLNQEQVASMLGRSRSAVANTLRLMGLTKAVRKEVVEGRLSGGHARTLRPRGARMDEAAQKVIDEGLSVRQTEALVKRLLEEQSQPRAERIKRHKSSEFQAAEKELGAFYETKVSLSGTEERGRIVMEYYSKEQLYALYEMLRRK